MSFVARILTHCTDMRHAAMDVDIKDKLFPKGTAVRIFGLNGSDSKYNQHVGTCVTCAHASGPAGGRLKIKLHSTVWLGPNRRGKELLRRRGTIAATVGPHVIHVAPANLQRVMVRPPAGASDPAPLTQLGCPPEWAAPPRHTPSPRLRPEPCVPSLSIHLRCDL